MRRAGLRNDARLEIESGESRLLLNCDLLVGSAGLASHAVVAYRRLLLDLHLAFECYFPQSGRIAVRLCSKQVRRKWAPKEPVKPVGPP